MFRLCLSSTNLIENVNADMSSSFKRNKQTALCYFSLKYLYFYQAVAVYFVSVDLSGLELPIFANSHHNRRLCMRSTNLIENVSADM
jgi:hypothetical protein